MKGHRFEPIKPTRKNEAVVCAICRLSAGSPIHLYALPGMEGTDAERAQAEALAQGEELTAELSKPLADISSRSGQMERSSPLFFGTGGNPGLF